MEFLLRIFNFDGLSPKASHQALYKKILLGFIPLIPVTRPRDTLLVLQTIGSHVADQFHSPVRPRLDRGNHVSTFFIHLPFKNYPAKGDRCLEKLTENQMTTLNAKID